MRRKNEARGVAGGPMRVLVTTRGFASIDSAAYELPFSALDVKALSWRTILEAHLTRDHLAWAEVLVLCRCLAAATLALARLARRMGILVVYELDDDLLNPPRDEPWGGLYARGSLPYILRAFLACVDLVKAGSPELARRLETAGYRAVYLPYAVPMLTAAKIPPGPYRIGYYGTPHHQKDIVLLMPAFRAVQAAFGQQVEFEFIGCCPEEWPELNSAQVLPHVSDYQGFLALLAARGWTLGVAPLRDTSFNTAKSDSKFREYAAAGIPGVYADLPPYRDSVIHGLTGWLCGASPSDWAGTMAQALETPHARRGIAESARNRVLDVNSPLAVGRLWVRLLTGEKADMNTVR